MNHEFRPKQSTTNFTIGMGVVLLVVGFLAMSANGNPSSVGMGIMVIAMGMWNRSRVIIALRDDHMEMKPAPISSTKMILYSEMTSLDEQGKKASLETSQGTIKLPLHLMEDADVYTLLGELQKRIKK
jgi:hypothetical protein